MTARFIYRVGRPTRYNQHATLKTTYISVIKQSDLTLRSTKFVAGISLPIYIVANYSYVLISDIVLPALLNANGKLSTPPPSTVLTRLTTAELTLPFRSLLSKRGTRNSKLAVRARIISSAALKRALLPQHTHCQERSTTKQGADFAISHS
jgi:hypothetical protein